MRHRREGLRCPRRRPTHLLITNPMLTTTQDRRACPRRALTLGIMQTAPAVTIATAPSRLPMTWRPWPRNRPRRRAGEVQHLFLTDEAICTPTSRRPLATPEGLIIADALDTNSQPRQPGHQPAGPSVHPLPGHQFVGWRNQPPPGHRRPSPRPAAIARTAAAAAPSALTRGTDANLAYVFTVSPKRADPVPGPRSAPELARYDKIHAERPGVPAPATHHPGGHGAGRAVRGAGP